MIKEIKIQLMCNILTFRLPNNKLNELKTLTSTFYIKGFHLNRQNTIVWRCEDDRNAF